LVVSQAILIKIIAEVIVRRFFVIATLLLCIAVESRAGVQYVTYYEPDEQGNYNGPTTTVCQAYASKKQRCRACEEVYDANTGQPTGKTCAYVPRAASCGCKTSPCSEYGSCSYLAGY
jgi:hypothetical protein